MLLNNVQMAFNSPKSFLYFTFLCLSWSNSIFDSFIIAAVGVADKWNKEPEAERQL